MAGLDGLVRVGLDPERRDVRTDSLLGEETQDRDVRERLRAEEDECLRNRLSDLACPGAQRLLAVDDERRPEAPGERARPESADRQFAFLDPRGIREQLQHPPILPGTLEFDDAASYVG